MDLMSDRSTNDASSSIDTTFSVPSSGCSQVFEHHRDHRRHTVCGSTWRLKALHDRYAKSRGSIIHSIPDAQHTQSYYAKSPNAITRSMRDSAHVPATCSTRNLPDSQNAQPSVASVLTQLGELNESLQAKIRSVQVDDFTCSGQAARDQSLAAADLLAQYEGVFIGDSHEDIEEVYLADWSASDRLRADHTTPGSIEASGGLCSSPYQSESPTVLVCENKALPDVHESCPSPLRIRAQLGPTGKLV